MVDGFERRRRFVTVPSWIRGALALRGVLWPLLELGGRGVVPEMEERFQADVEARGAEAASSFTGAGGAAARREPVSRS